MQISRRNLVLGGGALIGFAASAGAQKLVPTSGQDLGPFYPTIRPKDEDADLTRLRGAKGIARGEPINVIGRVVDLRGRPVRGVRLELWQANSVGRYDHPGDHANPAALDPNFQGSPACRATATATSSFERSSRARTILPSECARRISISTFTGAPNGS